MISTNDVSILIVDDEPSIRSLLSRFLTKSGYHCDTAEDVPLAKEMLSKNTYTLLLSDLAMPGETGLDLLNYAKEHNPEMGRIVITGQTNREEASDIISIGVLGYIVKPFTEAMILITVENSIHHLLLDNHLKSYMAEIKSEMSKRSDKLDAILNNLNVGVTMVAPDMTLLDYNKKMEEYFVQDQNNLKTHCYTWMYGAEKGEICDECPMAKTLATGNITEIEKQIETTKGQRDFRVTATPVYNKEGEIYAGINLYEDITEKLLIQKDLQQAQKLESIGQLAAGIAHEINTPVQYIGDNLLFLKDCFSDISSVVTSMNEVYPYIEKNEAPPPELLGKLKASVEDADFEYLEEEIPKTFQESIDGVTRVGSIVKAMKDFSHPGNDEQSLADINKIIDSTVTVCKNEWKYVAEVEMNLDPELELVPCFPSELSQVFLNIIVNGAHAIAESNQANPENIGKIKIQTKNDLQTVHILITDTGNGIPLSIQEKVFEPFFTTKERGKGTGQGLAIAYRVIVDTHGGSISLESEEGVGSTFYITLPKKS